MENNIDLALAKRLLAEYTSDKAGWEREDQIITILYGMGYIIRPDESGVWGLMNRQTRRFVDLERS